MLKKRMFFDLDGTLNKYSSGFNMTSGRLRIVSGYSSSSLDSCSDDIRARFFLLEFLLAFRFVAGWEGVARCRPFLAAINWFMFLPDSRRPDSTCCTASGFGMTGARCNGPPGFAASAS